MSTIQIILVALTAAVLGFIILSNKKASQTASGACSKCGAKSESLVSVDNQVLCQDCNSKAKS